MPSSLFDSIILISKESLNDNEVAMLGVGPLEALLAYNFEEYFLRLVQLSKENQNICQALKSVIPPDEYELEFSSKIRLD